MTQISKEEFKRFEEDLKEIISLRFEHVNEAIKKIDSKMDSMSNYQREVITDLAKVNSKAEKANHRLDTVESDIQDIRQTLDGDKDNPGLTDDIRAIKDWIQTKRKYWQKFVMALIALIVMTGGGIVLDKLLR